MMIMIKSLFNKWALPAQLIVWTIWETLGANERINSKQLVNYISNQFPEIDNVTMVWFGNTPLFIFICIFITSAFIFALYLISNHLIKEKSVPLIVKFSIVAVWLAGIVFNAYNSINGYIEMIKWNFYISAFAGIPLLIFSVLILIYFYLELKESASLKKK